MKNKTTIFCIVMMLVLIVALIIPRHSIIKKYFNLTRSTPIQISNIYITPEAEWLVTGGDSSINLNYEKKLISISVIKASNKAGLEKFTNYLNSNNIIYINKKYKVGSKIVDGVESSDKVGNVIYNNIKIVIDNGVLITISYSRADSDSSSKIVEAFLANNIKVKWQ
jgi:hypothetical protein